MQELSRFLSYAPPWQSFRRVDAEEFLEVLAIGDQDGIRNSPHRMDFQRRIRLHGRAMSVLQARYEWFDSMLWGDADEWTAHGRAIGEDDLHQRLLFAMHHTFMRARDLLRVHNDLLGNAPEYLLRPYGEPPQTDNDCRFVQVCVCKGAVAPFMSSCLMGDAAVLLPATARPAARPSQSDIDSLFN